MYSTAASHQTGLINLYQAISMHHILPSRMISGIIPMVVIVTDVIKFIVCFIFIIIKRRYWMIIFSGLLSIATNWITLILNAPMIEAFETKCVPTSYNYCGLLIKGLKADGAGTVVVRSR